MIDFNSLPTIDDEEDKKKGVVSFADLPVVDEDPTPTPDLKITGKAEFEPAPLLTRPQEPTTGLISAPSSPPMFSFQYKQQPYAQSMTAPKPLPTRAELRPMTKAEEIEPMTRMRPTPAEQLVGSVQQSPTIAGVQEKPFREAIETQSPTQKAALNKFMTVMGSFSLGPKYLALTGLWNLYETARQPVISAIKGEKITAESLLGTKTFAGEFAEGKAKIPLAIAEQLGEIAVMGALDSLAKKKLLTSSLNTVLGEMQKKGVDTANLRGVPAEVFEQAVKNTTLDKELKRWVKATQFVARNKNQIDAGNWSVVVRNATPDIKPIIADMKPKAIQQLLTSPETRQAIAGTPARPQITAPEFTAGEGAIIGQRQATPPGTRITPEGGAVKPTGKVSGETGQPVEQPVKLAEAKGENFGTFYDKAINPAIKAKDLRNIADSQAVPYDKKALTGDERKDKLYLLNQFAQNWSKPQEYVQPEPAVKEPKASIGSQIPPETKAELSQIATKPAEEREPVEFKRVNGKDIPVFEEKAVTPAPAPSTLPEQKRPLNVEKPLTDKQIEIINNAPANQQAKIIQQFLRDNKQAPSEKIDLSKAVGEGDVIRPLEKKANIGEIFIRKLNKSETTNPSASKNMNKIPEKAGYDIVYKPYGEQGRGYYYIPAEKPAETGEIVTETAPKTEISEAAPQVQEAPAPAIPTTPGEKVPPRAEKGAKKGIPAVEADAVKPELPPIPPKGEGKKTYLEGLSEEKFKLGGIKEGDSPFKQLEAFQRSQIIDIEKQIAKAKPDFDFAKARKESIGNANLRVYDLETGMKYLDHLEQNYATIKTPKEKPAPSPKTGHWIETQNKEWFGFLKGNNITPDNAKTKLGVKSMKEYTGTIDDAKKIVLAKEEPKMQAPVKVDDKKAPETPSLQERIREKVADRVLSSTLPEAKRQEIIDFVDKAIKNNPKLNMTESMRSKFITQFKERIGLLAKEYGVAGGELGQKMADANIKQQGYLENGYENFIDKVTDIYNDFDIEQRTEVNSLVFDALENRDDSSEILRDNKDAQKVYEIAKDFWDEFKKTLTSKGYATREDYISHAKDTFSIDNILSDIKDIDEADIRDLNNYIKEKSRFLQKRKDADIELLRDIPSLMKSYLHSVAKALSYKDVVEFYYKDFKKNIPVAFKNRSKQTAISYMTDNLNPEIGKGGIYKVIKNIRRNLYFNFLYMNLKYAAQNYPQKILTQLYTSKEAQKMTNRIFYINRSIEGNLQNATQEAQQINPRFTELVKDIEGATKSDKIRDVIEKYDIGKLSEISNWSYAEIAGIVDYLMKVPEYKGLVKGGMTPKQAFNKLLENQDTYNGAVRSGRDLASKTQISPAPAYRPEVFARPLNRALLMFQRFRFATIEMLSETMGKLEGAEGGRALSVLRRGLSGEADDVEVLRSVETLRKNIENVFKEYKKAKKSPELSVSNDEIDSYLNYLKFQEKELNNALKQKAPLGGSKSQIAKTWGKWYGIAVGISVAFQYLYEMRDDFVRGIIGKDEKKNKQTAARRVFRVLNDVSPLNTYNPSPFSTPIIPSFTNQMFIYGNFNKRGMFSAGVRYGFNVLPGLGFLDALTGRVGSDAITNIVSPPKNKKKSKKED